jgi:hypothetical protein
VTTPEQYANALAILRGIEPTKVELAQAMGITPADADKLLSKLVANHHVWPDNRGGTVVWPLTAAGRVAAEAQRG